MSRLRLPHLGLVYAVRPSPSTMLTMTNNKFDKYKLNHIIRNQFYFGHSTLAFEPPANTSVTTISSTPAGLSVQPSQLNFPAELVIQVLQVNALDDPDILDIQTNILSSPGAGNHLVDIIEDDDRQRITNLTNG